MSRRNEEQTFSQSSASYLPIASRRTKKRKSHLLALRLLIYKYIFTEDIPNGNAKKDRQKRKKLPFLFLSLSLIFRIIELVELLASSSSSLSLSFTSQRSRQIERESAPKTTQQTSVDRAKQIFISLSEFAKRRKTMRSAYELSSRSSHSSHRASPLSHDFSLPTGGASDRAEFHDRYQNRVTSCSFLDLLDRPTFCLSVRLAREESRHGSRFNLQTFRKTSWSQTIDVEMRRSSGSGKVSRSSPLDRSSHRLVVFPREFLKLNDECADKIYDIRERSDLSREWLLNSDGVASRFYQMEADAVRSTLLPPRSIVSFSFLVEKSLRIEQHETKIGRNQANACSSLQIEANKRNQRRSFSFQRLSMPMYLSKVLEGRTTSRSLCSSSSSLICCFFAPKLSSSSSCLIAFLSLSPIETFFFLY